MVQLSGSRFVQRQSQADVDFVSLPIPGGYSFVESLSLVKIVAVSVWFGIIPTSYLWWDFVSSPVFGDLSLCLFLEDVRFVSVPAWARVCTVCGGILSLYLFLSFVSDTIFLSTKYTNCKGRDVTGAVARAGARAGTSNL